MKEYIRSAPGTQGGVDASRLSGQEILETACFSSMSFDKRKSMLRTSPPIHRIALARIVSSARQSRKFSESAANVLLSLLGVSGGAI